MKNESSRISRSVTDPWWVTCVTQPLACFVFVSGAALSLRAFPSQFDWRYLVVSTLQSPNDNPAGYHWIAIAIAISGLLLLPLTFHFARSLQPYAPRGSQLVKFFLTTGITGMVLISVFTHRPASFPKLHDTLAVTTYVSLVLGLTTTALLYVLHPEATILPSRLRRLFPALLALLLFMPFIATCLTQLFVYLAYGAQTTVPKLALPSYLHIAFWEWILSGLIYVSGWSLAWIGAVPAKSSLLQSEGEVHIP